MTDLERYLLEQDLAETTGFPAAQTSATEE